MKFRELLEAIGDEPVFETGLLLAGPVNPADVRRQLSRWVGSGQVIQLRRGLYALAPPYGRARPHPFAVANRIAPGSYVSCQSALAYFDLIPEYTPAVVSVTPGRSARRETPLGNFVFRHMRPANLRGYWLAELGEGQEAFLARPEKALLDLVYLTPGGDTWEYLSGLRLQNLERLDNEELHRQAAGFGRPKLKRTAERVGILKERELEAYAREGPSSSPHRR